VPALIATLSAVSGSARSCTPAKYDRDAVGLLCLGRRDVGLEVHEPQAKKSRQNERDRHLSPESQT
jgi:hypothetical protein